MQFLFFIGQEVVEVVGQPERLVRGQAEEDLLAGFILDLELVCASITRCGDAGKGLGLQRTRPSVHEACVRPNKAILPS